MAGATPNPGIEGKDSGDGAATPFGDGQGAPQTAGAATGAHDFVTDAESHAVASGGRDFTKESRPQAFGTPSCINPDDMAPGGRSPFPQMDAIAASRPNANVSEVGTGGHKPFRVGG